MVDEAIAELSSLVGVRAACRALGEPQACFYRRHRQSPLPARRSAPARPPAARRPQPRALSEPERARVLQTLDSPEHVDQAPRTVHATLLDQGVYLCSPSTMYRLLRAAGQVRERRRQATHPALKKPELLAGHPNQVWSWDISKLKGPVKWSYFYLYVLIDIFSRYVVGWTLAGVESQDVAKVLVAETLSREHLEAGQITLHSDRGAVMTASPFVMLLTDLGIEISYSRPHTPNDNPYSEAHFKTFKYRPAYPARFGCIEDAHAWCAHFFDWYNEQHLHSGIGFHTPSDVHHGRAAAVRAHRALTLNAAYLAHPERFVRKRPEPPALPAAAWINQPQPAELASDRAEHPSTPEATPTT